MTVYITKTISLTNDSDIPPKFSRELRRADGFIRYGVLAAHNILGDEEPDLSHEQNCSLFMASSYGPMEANMEILHQVATGQQTSPTLFSHSVFNAAAGYLSRIFQLRGSALTITDFGFPFFIALQQAIMTLECGLSSSCLVIQIETFSQLLDKVRKTFCKIESPQWEPGACAWLLTKEAANSGAVHIDNFSLKTTTAKSEYYLQLQHQLDINGELFPLKCPLDAAMTISKALNNRREKKYTFSLLAPDGRMHLTVSS